MRLNLVRRAALALSLARFSLAGLAPAVAQSAPGAPGTSQTIPEKVQPKLDTTPAPSEGRSSSGTLSDKLDKSNGVIPAPQGVDPDMHRQAPATGTMPVVPPPAGGEAK